MAEPDERRDVPTPSEAISPAPRSVPPDVLSTYADRTDDAALVAGLAVDDSPAATAFVRRFQGAVFGLALSVTRDASHL